MENVHSTGSSRRTTEKRKDRERMQLLKMERLAAVSLVSLIMMLCIKNLRGTGGRDVMGTDSEEMYHISVGKQSDMIFASNMETDYGMASIENEGETETGMSSDTEQLTAAAAYLSGNLSDTLSAEDAIAGYAELEGYELSDYPDELIELYGKNPDAREYVLEYPEKKDMVYDINLDEYKDCTEVPLLMQWDERWGYGTYSGEIFGRSACGPTCLSMAAIYLLGDTSMNPRWMADFATENGYSTNGSGSAWTLMSVGAAQLGMQVSELSLDEEIMKQSLDDGNIIICIVGPGDFTDGGHYILIRGYDDEGFIVNDSNSYTNSAKRWSFDTLRPQIRNQWKLGCIRQ